MFIIVNHRISDMEFWAAAQRELPRLPAGISVHYIFPNVGGTIATCLWQAPTEEVLHTYLEKQTGQYAANEYIVVDGTKAMGLPK